jgi:hypothetical protein
MPHACQRTFVKIGRGTFPNLLFRPHGFLSRSFLETYSNTISRIPPPGPSRSTFGVKPLYSAATLADSDGALIRTKGGQGYGNGADQIFFRRVGGIVS